MEDFETSKEKRKIIDKTRNIKSEKNKYLICQNKKFMVMGEPYYFFDIFLG